MGLTLHLKSQAGNRSVHVLPDSTVEDLKALLHEQHANLPPRYTLVCKGAQLTDDKAHLKDVCVPGDTLVVLPRRAVAPRCAPETTPVPTATEISAAIKAELVELGPEAVAAAEAAATEGSSPAPAAAPNAFAALAAALMGEGDQAGALEEALGSEGAAAVQAQLAALMQNLAQHMPEGADAGGLQVQLPDLGLEGYGLGEGGSDEEEEEEEEEDEDDVDEEENGSTEAEDEDEDNESEGEGGNEEGGESRAGPPPLRIPDPDAESLAQLTEMGFTEALCRNALLLNRNQVERALEWVMEHADDPHAAEPISEERLAAIYRRGRPRNARQPDPNRLAQLRDMGFEQADAEVALRMFGNNVAAAANWLLHLGPLRAAGQAAASSPRIQHARADVHGGVREEDQPAGQPAHLADQAEHGLDTDEGSSNESQQLTSDGSVSQSDAEPADGSDVDLEDTTSAASAGSAQHGLQAGRDQAVHGSEEECPPLLHADSDDENGEDL